VALALLEELEVVAVTLVVGEKTEVWVEAVLLVTYALLQQL